MESRLRNEIERVIYDYKELENYTKQAQDNDTIIKLLENTHFTTNKVDDETLDITGIYAIYTIYNGELINSIDYVDYNLYSYVMSVEDFEKMLKGE